ncbi:MAG: hypothetical protein GKC08_00565 [Methanosarcinales archaeon]|nr:hypothetical protein [Methanosarcinales archaeon]
MDVSSPKNVPLLLSTAASIAIGVIYLLEIRRAKAEKVLTMKAIMLTRFESYCHSS